VTLTAAGFLRVRRLRVERLRNIERVELELGEGQSLLVGGNGQGKTSLLEAIYLLGAVRSFRGARPGELVQHGAQDALVRGTLGAREPASDVVVSLTRKERQVRVDGKRVDLADHFRLFPMVAFHPGDLELVFGGPAERRRFLDRMLFQAEAGYPRWYREYRRALQSRNELLKRCADDREVRAYDQVLSSHGARMGAARARLSALLARATSEVLEELGVEPFAMRLRATVEPDEAALLAALERALPGDRRRGRTSVGPHTDELELSRETGGARVVASRGEARALAVAMRLGERRVVAGCAQSTPLLLLDDVWAELDRPRAERVLAMVAAEPGQVIVTGTGGSEPSVVSSWRRFEVVEGRIHEARPGGSDSV
jgi:DNA replication and repair protein RecF